MKSREFLKILMGVQMLLDKIRKMRLLFKRIHIHSTLSSNKVDHTTMFSTKMILNMSDRNKKVHN